ncbi:MAG: S8 family serine peptidase [Clostridia bacterium]|nr:S8 family serine peptidase [Clostridia bacterium]
MRIVAARKRKLLVGIKRLALVVLTVATVFCAFPVFAVAESNSVDDELIEYYKEILDQPNALLGVVFATFEHGTPAEDKYAALYSTAKELYPNESEDALNKRIKPFNNDDVGILEVEDEDTLAALVIVSKKQHVLFAEPNYSLPKDAPDEELIEYYQGVLDQPNALLGVVFATFEHGTSAEDKYAAMYSAAKELYPDEPEDSLSKRIHPFNNDDVGILEVEDEDTLTALVIISKKQHVLFAEPNYSLPKDGWSYMYDPGDVNNSNNNWHLYASGVLESWNMGFSGSNNTKIAVIDSGFLPHTDYNSHIDWSLAYNAYTQVYGMSNISYNPHHGTLVVGVIAAVLNNNGATGVCPEISIIPINVCDYDGSCDNWAVYRAVTYAANNGTAVMNFSRSFTYSAYLENAISNSQQLFVCAAGNDGVDITSNSIYSGIYQRQSDYIFSVGGTKPDSNNDGFCDLYDNTNYSSTYVDIMAPAVSVYITVPDNNFDFKNGTSLATPIVTAAVALISEKATHLNALDIKERLMQRVIQPGIINPDVNNPFFGKCVSKGYLSISSTILSIYHEYRGEYTRGDGNGDGHITSVDYAMAKRTFLGTYYPETQESFDALDIDGDGNISSSDYTKIKRYYLETYYFTP